MGSRVVRSPVEKVTALCRRGVNVRLLKRDEGGLWPRASALPGSDEREEVRKFCTP